MFSHNIFGGQQQKWLIAFYGYGQAPLVYQNLFAKLKDTHNILVIDNPTQDYSEDITPEDFKNYLDKVLRKEQVEKFDSISYSMGSRFNLYLPIYYPTQLNKIILIAPDGIKINFWNRIAVHTWLGQSLFKFFVEKDEVYVGLLSLLYKLRILNKALYAFSKWNMRNKVQRTHVYNAWMNMRCIEPDLKIVRQAIRKHNIKLNSFFGKNDAVIPLKNYKKCKKAFPEGNHILIEGEHDFMNNDFFTLITEELRK